jgi:hypothetical protein
VFLLGAGASAEAGVPTTFEATKHLVEAINTAQGPWRKTAQALNFVCGALVAYDSAAGGSPYAGLDVERVMSAIELLAERETLEVTPFIGAWHPAVDEWDRPNPPPFFDNDFSRAVLGEGIHKPGRLISDLVASVTGRGSGRVYRRLASEMVQALRSLLVVKNGDEHYLAPLLDAAAEPGGITIATLNYDLAIEQLASSRAVDVQTGIERWVHNRTWGWKDDGLRLLKLHGSIDWCWDAAGKKNGEMPRKTIEISEKPHDDHRQPAVLFGQRGKLRAEGPFLSLLAEFERFLADAAELIVVGYSFRDEHINETIRHWTAEDSGRTITIVDPSFPESVGYYQEGFGPSLVTYLNPGKYEREPWQPRVTVLREVASKTLPTLV